MLAAGSLRQNVSSAVRVLSLRVPKIIRGIIRRLETRERESKCGADAKDNREMSERRGVVVVKSTRQLCPVMFKRKSVYCVMFRAASV